MKQERGNRKHLQVFDKAMYVLVAALWEAYAEDVITEALDRLANECKDPQKLPISIQKEVVRRIATEKHDLAPWSLTGDGWRDQLRGQLDAMRDRRDWVFNNPSTSRVDEVFRRTLGIDRISDSWNVRGGSAEQIRMKLDSHMHTRGAIAHRRAAAVVVLKKDVKEFFGLIDALVTEVDKKVGELIFDVTGRGWEPGSIDSMSGGST